MNPSSQKKQSLNREITIIPVFSIYCYLRQVILVLSLLNVSSLSALQLTPTEDEQQSSTTRSLRGYIVNQHMVELPRELIHLGDVAYPVKSNDVPVYWHVLKSGGTTMKHIFCQCYDFVVATENGHAENKIATDNLRIIWNDGMSFVNVDTSTPQGISKAKSLHLAQSGKANVIITPLMHEMADIFDTNHRGRMFTMLRHPIDRAVSMFYYLQVASWESTYDPKFSEMTIEEYASSDKVEENWMTRFLVNKKNSPLGPDDVILAREILRRKFLIGLLSRPEESMQRFNKYFGWNNDTPEKVQCAKNLLKNGVNRQEHPSIRRGGEAWNKLMENNKYDLELYMYSVQLFEEQKTFVELGDIGDF